MSSGKKKQEGGAKQPQNPKPKTEAPKQQQQPKKGGEQKPKEKAKPTAPKSEQAKTTAPAQKEKGKQQPEKQQGKAQQPKQQQPPKQQQQGKQQGKQEKAEKKEKPQPKQKAKQPTQGKQQPKEQQQKGSAKQTKGKQEKGKKSEKGKTKGKAQTQVKSAKQEKGGKKKKGQEKKKASSAKKTTTKKTKGSSKKKTTPKHGSKTRTKSKTKKTGGDGKKKKLGYRLRNTRQRGRQSGNEKLWQKLRPTEDDVLKMLAAQVHIGPVRAHANMQRYVFERRKDALHVINLDKTWHKMILAARILAAVQNPADIMVMSTRTYGQRGAIKFAHYTGATPMVGKWIPGTFSNPRNKAFAEPRLLLVDDPATCFAALRETSYVGIPVIALCGVNNNTRFVDCAVPCNNRGKLSLGLMFWLLAREMLRIKKIIPRDKPWDAAPVDLFFYRDPDKIKKAQEEKAKKQEQQEHGGAQVQMEYQEEQAGGGDGYAGGRGDFGIEQLQTWDQEPRHVLEDWAAADVMIDQGYGDAEQQYEMPYNEQPFNGTTEEQAFGRVRMQEW